MSRVILELIKQLKVMRTKLKPHPSELIVMFGPFRNQIFSDTGLLLVNKNTHIELQSGDLTIDLKFNCGNLTLSTFGGITFNLHITTDAEVHPIRLAELNRLLADITLMGKIDDFTPNVIRYVKAS